jgi:hypothetical protein
MGEHRFLAGPRPADDLHQPYSRPLAATDPESFAHTLEQAADWLHGRNIDLVLIDPPSCRAWTTSTSTAAS